MPRRITTAGSTPRLLSPSDVAGVLGCSEWWVKEQARRRRIPFTKVGGAYKFTRAHVDDIIAIFEQRPDQQPPPDTGAGPQRRGAPPSATPIVQLRARRPRRPRDAG